MIGKPIFNKTPLLPNRLAPLPLGAILPEGWVRAQLDGPARARLRRVMDAMPDACADSAWFGGHGDDTEKSCLLFEAYVLLAWSLDDRDMQETAKTRVEYLLNHQQEDGDFGPMTNPDAWPRMVMLRTLIALFTATADKRILVFLDRYFRGQLRWLADRPLTGRAVARAGENMLAVLWLYNLTGQEYLLALYKMLHEQSLDWTNEYHIFPHIRAMSRQRPKSDMRAGCARERGLVGGEHPPYSRDDQLSDAVNHAISMKTPGAINLVKSGFKEVNAFETGFHRLLKYHGAACGMFTGDTHLAGNSPTAGISLQAVVELIRSLEALIGMQDDVLTTASDALEKVAFNALMSMLPDAYPVVESLSQTNQVSVTQAPRDWYDLGDDATLFGIGAGDPLASVSGAQDMASLLRGAWYVTSDEGLAAVSYIPCSVNYMAGGTRVRLTVETKYPFEGVVRIHTTVKAPCEFPLYLRVPRWAEQANVRLPDGEIMQLRNGETACVRRQWSGTETIVMDMPMAPVVTPGYHLSASVGLGPLVMCYRPSEDWAELNGARYQVTTADAWNWAILKDQPMKSVVDAADAGAFHALAAGVRVLTKAAIIPEWGMQAHAAAQPPVEPVVGHEQVQTIQLVPYGMSALRIAQFPVAQTREETT